RQAALAARSGDRAGRRCDRRRHRAGRAPRRGNPRRSRRRHPLARRVTRIAITRALPDAERTAERVTALGATPVIAPPLSLLPCGYDTNVEDAQALLFTSANGVRAFPDARRQSAKVVLTVGDATAEAARAAGFTTVRSADGDVEALALLARQAL